MRAPVLLPLLLCATSALAAETKLPAEAIRAQRTYDTAKSTLDKQYVAERQRLDTLYRDKLGSLRAGLVTELHEAKVAAAQRVDLAAANAVQAIIDAVPTVHEVPGAVSEDRGGLAALDGIWHCVIKQGNEREYRFTGGRAEYQAADHRGAGTFERSSGAYVVRVNPGKHQH